MRRSGLPAFALAVTLYASSAGAQNTREAPANSGIRYPEVILVDPATGLGYAATGGSGGGGAANAYPGADYAKNGTGGPAYGPDALGATSTKPPILSGLLDANGSVRAVSPTFPWPSADSIADAALGTPADAASASGANSTVIAALRSMRDRLLATLTVTGTVTANLGALNGVATDATSQAIKTTLGSPFQAGGALGPSTALIGRVGIDQTTPGTTNKVSIGTDGTVGQGTSGTTPWRSAESGSSDITFGIAPVVAQSATSLVGKGSAGNLYSVYALLTATASVQTYLVTINAATVPASGAAIAPVDVALFPSSAIGSTASMNFTGGPPDAYSTGVVHLVTTSLTTYTPGTASFISSRVR